MTKNIQQRNVLMIATMVMIMTSTTAFTGNENVEAIATNNEFNQEQLECFDQVTELMHEEGKLINEQQALAKAGQSQEFIERTSGFNKKFHSIHNTWNIDYNDCDVQLRNVNVGYKLYNDKDYVKNIVISLESDLSSIDEVSEHVGAIYGYETTSDTWSGYELGGESFSSSTDPTEPVWETEASYTLPAVDPPSASSCESNSCNLAIWTGLVDDKGAGNTHIAQAGTDQKIDCDPCSTDIFFWYQFDTQENAFQCSTDIDEGESALITVTNQGKSSGSPSNDYDVSMQNTSTGLGCSISDYTYLDMDEPIYGEFINERATYDDGLATLAEFDTDTVTGWMYYDGANHDIHDPYSNGGWHRIIMDNDEGTNIDVGIINIGGYFTFDWESSDGT